MSNELPPLPAPWDYVYVFDQWGGQHRSLRAASRNGRGPDKSEQVFTADQMRDYARAAALQEREACAIEAWNHYMDECSRTSRAPAMWNEWCAATAIRARSTK